MTGTLQPFPARVDGHFEESVHPRQEARGCASPVAFDMRFQGVAQAGFTENNLVLKGQIAHLM